MPTQWPLAQNVLSLPTTFPHSGWRSRSTMAPLPLAYPITSDTASFGGILTQAWTWSLHTLPSMTSHPFLSKSPLTRAPTSGLLCWQGTLRLYLGIQTMWYVQSHLVCDKLAWFIGFLPFPPRSGHRGGTIMGRKPFLYHPNPAGWNHPPTTGIACGFLSATKGPCSQRWIERDHPRMRGEHRRSFFGKTNMSGSSPHARGARAGDAAASVGARIIPACAGSTGWRIASSPCAGDHPRMRGEHTTVSPGM